MVVTYAGTGSDAEDGTLPGTAFTWQVDFLHDTHSHPFVAARSGATSGTFTIPTTGETSANVRYRIFLTVRDSQGLVHQTFRDILPQKVTLSLASSPPGLQLRLDGQPVTTPHSFESVVGIVRNLSAPSPQTLNGTAYEFVSWSSGRPATHDVATPSTNSTYTVTYRAAVGSTGNGLTGAYFNNTDFTNLKITRVDPVVDFAWSYGAPHSSMSPDTFSVRWTGQIEAPSSETFTFYTQSNDGVRLWIDGQLLIDNWTNHALTENRAAFALVAGRRYSVRLEFYEATGTATARLLWSSSSTPKAVVPAGRLFPDPAGSAAAIRVNFQTAAAPVPAGYLRDAGAVFGDRGNGYVYGWNADNAAQTRDRNAANSPDQRYDTLVYMQRPANPNATWEIALANATYRVRIVAGDPSYFGYGVAIAAEGVLAVSGTTTSAVRWLEGTVTVTVADGKLTIGNASSTTANEICFVEITRE
jgi:hypothetical protein